jgi:uncharacterized protein
MKIYITAKPKKKNEYVEQVDSTHYVVAVKEPAQQGKANQAIINSLATYFDVPKAEIFLASGQTSKHKIFEVPDNLAHFEPDLKQKRLF